MVIDKIGFNGPFWLVFKLVILKKDFSKYTQGCKAEGAGKAGNQLMAMFALYISEAGS